MIHEFAVDPDALASWQNFRYLTEKFGIENGRLISRFPKRWKKMVYQACSGCGDREKKRIEVALEYIDEKLFPAGRAYDPNQAWIENAVNSHAQDPFRAIVTVAGKLGRADLLDVDELSDSDDQWRVDRGCPVERKAGPLAAAAESLLFCASEVVLVDAYYSKSAKHGKPLTRFIAFACLGTTLKRLEYHLVAKGTDDFFRQGLEEQRQYMNLPADGKLIFIRWQEKEEGEAFHARYILTNRGGISYDHGLDEGEDGESTDVNCLSAEVYKKRWQQFHPEAGTFEIVDAWIVTSASVKKAEWKDGDFVEIE